jgi:DNA replication protein DnaC
MKRVEDWTFGPTGLFLFGPTDTFKTRCLYHLLDRLHFEEQRTWQAFGARGTFGDECAKAYLEGRGPKWIQDLVRRMDILLFEDLGKEKLTDRAADALYQVVEGRCAYLKPILAAANCSAKELSERLGHDRGPPLVRRLRETCLTITVTRKVGRVRVVTAREPSRLVALTAQRLREQEADLRRLQAEGGA